MARPLIALAALALAAPLAAQTPPAPTAEAEALGRRVADTGTLAALLPLLIAKDTDALIAEHPELDDAGKAKLRAAAAATVDAGKLPGTASTVIDFTGAEPRVLREGAASGAEAIDRALAAVA